MGIDRDSKITKYQNPPASFTYFRSNEVPIPPPPPDGYANTVTYICIVIP